MHPGPPTKNRFHYKIMPNHDSLQRRNSIAFIHFWASGSKWEYLIESMMGHHFDPECEEGPVENEIIEDRFLHNKLVVNETVEGEKENKS